MNYGYARVSTREQNLDRQLDEFKKCPIDKVFAEKRSGKDFDRTQYRNLIRTLKEGDCVYILSIDRLGRSYEGIQKEWMKITQTKHCDIVVLDMPILNTKSQVEGLDGKFISNLVLQILAYVAQKEREKNKERQAQGIKSAMARGVKFGRPAIEITDSQKNIIKKLLQGGYQTIEEAVKESGLTRATFYRKLEIEKERINL